MTEAGTDLAQSNLAAGGSDSSLNDNQTSPTASTPQDPRDATMISTILDLTQINGAQEDSLAMIPTEECQHTLNNNDNTTPKLTSSIVNPPHPEESRKRKRSDSGASIPTQGPTNIEDTEADQSTQKVSSLVLYISCRYGTRLIVEPGTRALPVPYRRRWYYLSHDSLSPQCLRSGLVPYQKSGRS